VLTYWDSLRYACCSVYHLSRNDHISISDSYQVGITAFAAGLIWRIDDKVLGPNEWNVRAILLTPHVVKVSSLDGREFLANSDLSKVQILGSGAILYSLTMFFAKLALFLLYYRIFARNRWTRIAIYLGIAFNGLFYLASCVALIVLCVPRRGESWTSIGYATRCTHAEAMGDVQGIFGLISDLYIFILPLPVLFSLQMTLRKKLGITAVFLTGLM